MRQPQLFFSLPPGGSLFVNLILTYKFYSRVPFAFLRTVEDACPYSLQGNTFAVFYLCGVSNTVVRTAFDLQIVGTGVLDCPFKITHIF